LFVWFHLRSMWHFRVDIWLLISDSILLQPPKAFLDHLHLRNLINVDQPTIIWKMLQQLDFHFCTQGIKVSDLIYSFCLLNDWDLIYHRSASWGLCLTLAAARDYLYLHPSILAQKTYPFSANHPKHFLSHRMRKLLIQKATFFCASVNY